MPSTMLENLTTPSGWKVINLINTNQVSGGNFCTRYVAESPTGKVGFLKAMDLVMAFNQNNGRDPLENVRDTINSYLFEQKILDECKSKRMTKVVTPLDVGVIETPLREAPLNRVYYVIFEMADADLRVQFLENEVKSWVKLLTSLHHTIIGVNQLHKGGIIHQDIKPSNILYFRGEISKVADLGRVTDAAGTSPYINIPFTGDTRYAPPEIKYGINGTEFVDRKLSDLYMVGSLIYQMITGADMATALFTETRLIIPNLNMLSFPDALPFFNTAFITVLNRFENECQKEFGIDISKSLKEIVYELCNPDPSLRGNTRKSNKFQRLSMERYVGKMANIVRQAKTRGVN